MKPFYRIAVLIAIYLLYCVGSFAQIKDSSDFRGNTEIVISDGILSQDQCAAINEGKQYKIYKDMPYSMAGAVFITCRYYWCNRLAIGLAAGFDNQKGNLSYGPPKFRYDGFGHSGAYRRNIYTIAPEVLYVYRRKKRNMLYCFIGAGLTFGSLNYSLSENGKRVFARHWANTDPYIVNVSHFNAQVTPVAFCHRDKSGRLHTFIEFGFGYKGLVSVGTAVHLGRIRMIGNQGISASHS